MQSNNDLIVKSQQSKFLYSVVGWKSCNRRYAYNYSSRIEQGRLCMLMSIIPISAGTAVCAFIRTAWSLGDSINYPHRQEEQIEYDTTDLATKQQKKT